ncbi:hypothetical protein QTI51_27975 [Variovorax sp. J22G73]|uniref:hypothetical protein n=1 Tax=unclassified Variovorax TaxID=663243 RepID=UPI000D5D780F|nr:MULTISPECIES: hypothetical protein [unclassified Variovorax]MDM0008640.1 hypothetical protein [Variovorax sp. J22R203]MDM0101147.1 hypothetical protein [Variovorax sp. J22G73]
MAAALSGAPHAAPGPQRYWAPCLAVALVAMFFFYVALTDLVKESAARAPAQAVAMPAVVQAPLLAAANAAEFTPPPARVVAAVPARVARPAAVVSEPIVATPVRFEVTKCVTPSGEAEYSDGACSEGARATTLRLQ